MSNGKIMKSKVTTAREAVRDFVSDGMVLYLGGFGHLYAYGLTHEVIRQKKRNLTVAKHSPELIADQLIGAGCVKKLLFGYIGNPRVGPAHCFDRALKNQVPNQIELEEYSHHALTARIRAGSYGLPFMPTKSMLGSSYQEVNPNVKTVTDPFTGAELIAVPALKPDVTLIHVQRCDERGNSQAWGVLGDIKEAAFASKRVIVSTEQIVSSEVIQSDPNRTVIPSFKVDAVVEQPWGAHPSYTQGFYDRDNSYYFEYEGWSRTLEGFETWMKDWIYDLEDRRAYVEKLGQPRIEKLKVKTHSYEPVNYGVYS